MPAYRLSRQHRHADDRLRHTGPDVSEGQTITRVVADTLWSNDLATFERGVCGLVANVPTTQQQFDAL